MRFVAGAHDAAGTAAQQLWFHGSSNERIDGVRAMPYAMPVAKFCQLSSCLSPYFRNKKCRHDFTTSTPRIVPDLEVSSLSLSLRLQGQSAQPNPVGRAPLSPSPTRLETTAMLACR